MIDQDHLRTKFNKLISDSASLTEIENVRVLILGKKGELTALIKNLATMEPNKRKTFGKSLNELKAELLETISKRKTFLKELELNSKLMEENIDISLSGRPEQKGYIQDRPS